MRDVNYGWLLRYFHSNGASMFFIIVYVHIFRGLYYGSYVYPRSNVWIIGVLILLVMIITAFLGYVLPWGQMSFWGATVITNLCSAIPVFGTDIVYWLWGGFSVDNPTLNRFFSFHFLLPFVLVAMTFVHIFFLHLSGSNNPLGISFASGTYVPFYPYYIIKDLFGFIIFMAFWFYFVFFVPNVLGHSDNYIPANPLVTPPHIVPEWYFLPFYAILRAIPDKLSGVLALLFSILILLILPFLTFSFIRTFRFKPASQVIFFFFLFVTVLLGWLGSKPVGYPYYELAQIFTIFNFIILLFMLPVLSFFENFFFWDRNPEDLADEFYKEVILYYVKNFIKFIIVGLIDLTLI